MSDKARDFFSAFKAGRMSRRELMVGAGGLGISAATANFMLYAAATQASSADFDWKKCSGKKLHLLLNKHPYADAMIADLANFKTITERSRGFCGSCEVTSRTSLPTSSMPIAWPVTHGGRPSRASQCRLRGPASPRPACWPSSSAGTISCSRSSSPWASKQPVTVGALAFVTASGIQYGQSQQRSCFR